jgi:hypothetical protein
MAFLASAETNPWLRSQPILAFEELTIRIVAGLLPSQIAAKFYFVASAPPDAHAAMAHSPARRLIFPDAPFPAAHDPPDRA